MEREAHAGSTQIRVDTIFSIPTVTPAGRSLGAMQKGMELVIFRPRDPQPLRSKVISASPTELVIEMDDGTRWRMTPVRADERGLGIDLPGKYPEDWRIREPVT